MNTDQRLAAAVSEHLPQFAGHFLSDNERTLNILLVDGTMEHAECAARLLAAYHHDPSLEQRDITIHAAEFAWHDLAEWGARLSWNLEAEGVHSFGVDVRVNRITVGVEDPAVHRDGVMQQVRDLGIPEAAVLVEEEEAVSPAA